MPSIRHLAIRCASPATMAEFYKSVFDLQEVWRASDNRVVYLTDGVINLALLPPHAAGGEDDANGLNHFGFQVESIDEIQEKLALAEVPPATRRPQDGRRYAEYRACDPEGNWFDLAEKGWTLEAPPPAVE
ncbi:MAG TPA: VOC family protein [Chloroflexota bacterium]|nr:VOC family protein [Chloroflexota bacterium]